MKRMKERWQDLNVPARVLEQARDSAWKKLHRPPLARSAWFAAAAAMVMALALYALWPRGTSIPARDSLTAPHGPVVSLPLEIRDRNAVDWAGAPELAARLETPGAPIAASTEPRPKLVVARNDPDGARQLVLNFDLPESGVRVVWIKKEDFELSGGAE